MGCKHHHAGMTKASYSLVPHPQTQWTLDNVIDHLNLNIFLHILFHSLSSLLTMRLIFLGQELSSQTSLLHNQEPREGCLSRQPRNSNIHTSGYRPQPRKKPLYKRITLIIHIVLKNLYLKIKTVFHYFSGRKKPILS